MIRKIVVAGLFLAIVPLTAYAATAEDAKPVPGGEPAETVDMGKVDRGRYLVEIAGCNDCHTAGYRFSEGKVPEKSWLTGDKFGWRGPWGTTYGSNFALFPTPPK